MTNLWQTTEGFQRLILSLKQAFSPDIAARFEKYDVAPRRGAQTLRRRLLLRPQAISGQEVPDRLGPDVAKPALLQSGISSKRQCPRQ